MTPEERIAELEKKLAEQAAELEKLRSALEQNGEALDAWKRGRRSRPGGKKAQRTVDATRPKRAPGRAVGHVGCSRHVLARVDREVFLPPPERRPDCGSNVELIASRPRRMVVEELSEQLRTHIRGATHRWMHETPHRVGSDNGWLWMARPKTVVWFVHALSRSKDVVHSMLGSRCDGVILSDLYGACFAVEGAKHAVCWAHAMSRSRCGPARSERGAQTYAVNLSAVRTMNANGQSFESLMLHARGGFSRGQQFLARSRARAQCMKRNHYLTRTANADERHVSTQRILAKRTSKKARG